jgi:hypothetical protein
MSSMEFILKLKLLSSSSYSTGKMRLTESIRGGVVPSGNSSTPVITHAIAPPFRLR